MSIDQQIREAVDGPVARPELAGIERAGRRHNVRRRMASGAVALLAVGAVGVGVAVARDDQPVENPGFSTDPDAPPLESTAPTLVPVPETGATSTTAPVPHSETGAYDGNAPMLLLAGDEWTVERVQEDAGSGTGEMTFVRDGTAADLHWRDGDFEGWVADRVASSDLATTATVLGAEAEVIRYAGGGGSFTALWQEDGRTLEFRADGISDLTAFTDLLHSLERVSVEDWLAALPESAVVGSDSPTVIDALLEGLPVPPGFDRDAVVPDGVVDDYQLGARVSGAVACGWISQWVTATEAGDEAGAAEAVAALAGARDWPVLVRMADAGDWPLVVWQYADAVVDSTPVPAGSPEVDVAGSYRAALGCAD